MRIGVPVPTFYIEEPRGESTDGHTTSVGRSDDRRKGKWIEMTEESGLDPPEKSETEERRVPEGNEGTAEDHPADHHLNRTPYLWEVCTPSFQDPIRT